LCWLIFVLPAGDSQSFREHSPRRWTLLAFLATGMFFCYARRGTLSVAAPFMMQDLGLSKAAMGVLLSAFFWSYSLAQVPAGWVIDRFGVGRVYAIGFLVWTLAVALTGIPSTIAMLIALRVLLGIGQSVAFPASARAAASWFPSGERGGVTGVYLSGNRLGQAAIGAAGPAVITAFGWRYFFLIAGLAGFVWLGAWLLSIRSWETKDISASGSATAQLSLGGACDSCGPSHGWRIFWLLRLRLRLVSVPDVDA
jgi:sugar phosphate permease